MLEYQTTITSQEINKLPLIEFKGKIHIIDTHQELLKSCDFLKEQNLLGFDTEAKPSFRKGVINPVALLQLACREDVFLIRVLKTGMPIELKRILENEEIEKTGVALEDDLKDLNKLRKFRPNGFVSLEKEVKKIGIESNGLRKLAGIILKKRISKGAQVSNWEAEELSRKQKVYAATDAWISLVMLEQLRSQFPEIFEVNS